MSNLIDFSDRRLHFATGTVNGICEANATNFPALKSFFKFKEKSGNTITDAIGGGFHTDATNIVYSSTYDTMATNIAAGTVMTSGAIPNPGLKHILIVAAGLVSASATGTVAAQTVASIGAGSVTANAGGYLFANNTGGTSICSVADGSTTVSTTALSALSQDVKYGFSAAYERGQIIQSRRFPSLTGAIVAQTSAGTVQATDVTGIASFNGIRFSGIWFGFAIFHFSTLPRNWEAGAAWMSQQWINGNKYIYPGFKGLT